MTAEERAAWDLAEGKGYDTESVSNLIRVFVEARVPQQGILVKDTAERIATVRGSAFNAQWKQGNYGTAVAHAAAGVVESFGAAIFGRTIAETYRNVGVMYALSAVVGGLAGVSKAISARPSRYVPLSQRPPPTQTPPTSSPGPPAGGSSGPSYDPPRITSDVQPTMVDKVGGLEVTGVVINGRTYYGPFHRAEAAGSGVTELISASKQLWGQPARNIYTSDVPAAKAYVGELPPGKVGVEFYTPVRPTNMSPGTVYWHEGAPGVKSISVNGTDYAAVDIVPTRVNPGSGG